QQSFVFNVLWTLLAKTPGGGYGLSKKTSSVAERCSANSTGAGWQRRQKRAGTVPDDLHANAHEQERRQLQDHRHARRAQHAAQAIGKAVTEVNARCQEHAPEKRRQDTPQMQPMMIWSIRTQRERHGYGPGPHRQRQRQRIKRV